MAAECDLPHLHMASSNGRKVSLPIDGLSGSERLTQLDAVFQQACDVPIGFGPSVFVQLDAVGNMM